jgi:hypothetical protein
VVPIGWPPVELLPVAIEPPPVDPAPVELLELAPIEPVLPLVGPLLVTAPVEPAPAEPLAPAPPWAAAWRSGVSVSVCATMSRCPGAGSFGTRSEAGA